MRHYCVVEIEITDPSWIADYVREVTPIVEAHGGRYLARSSELERLEGDRPAPHAVVLLEWPSREAAEAFYTSEAYRPYLAGRLAGSRSQTLLFAAEDATGAASAAS